ncbi:MAG: BMP family protein [Suilimivivens sp.]
MKCQLKPYKLNLLFLILLLIILPGCNIKSTSSESTFVNNLSEDEGIDYYGDYLEIGGEVALVTDRSAIMDKGFNEAAFEGAKTYALAAGVTYSTYSAKENNDEAYEKVVLTAIENNAGLIICAGSHFEKAVGALQDTYPEVDFLLLDGVPKDASGREVPVSSNVHCILYHEEEAGYLAGYMTVMDGYTDLGFIGGEQLPAVERYGLGYLKGIDDAARELKISKDITVNYWYADTFFPDEEIEDISAKWYEDGTQVIFACGGSLYESVLASAKKHDGLLIGVDVDQSDISKLFLTSAVKGIQDSVIVALDDYFASGRIWPEDLTGQAVSYGAGKKCIELPTTDEAWRFGKVTTDDYYALLSRLKSDKISIPTDRESVAELSVNIIYHNN